MGSTDDGQTQYQAVREDMRTLRTDLRRLRDALTDGGRYPLRETAVEVGVLALGLIAADLALWALKLWAE